MSVDNEVPALTTAERRKLAKDKRRGEIVDAAIEIWAVKGSRGSGLTEVAERAGMTHAGLLHHFGSKANLQLAVMEERDRRDRSVLSEWFKAKDIRALWAHYPDVARANERDHELARLYVSFLGENTVPTAVGYEYFRNRYRELLDRTEAMLADAQAAGIVFGHVDCGKVAAEIVAFMDGAIVQWLLDPEEGKLVEHYEHYFGRLAEQIGLVR